jgi:hypothetical protein
MDMIEGLVHKENGIEIAKIKHPPRGIVILVLREVL